MHKKYNVTAHLILVLACFAWGGSYAVGRFGLSEGSALWLALWRWGPGAMIFLVYILWKWKYIGSVVLNNLVRLTFVSLLGVVLYPTTLFLAVANTTALNASLYLAVTPVLIVLLSFFVWKEAIGKAGLLAITLGLLGTTVLVFKGNFIAFLNFKIASSDFWAIISAFAWAGYCVSLPLKPKELPEVPFLAILIVIGSVVLFGAAIMSKTSIPIPNTANVAWSMVYFAIFPSIVAFLAWNWGTSIIGPSMAAPYNNLVPFVGGALGVIFLGEDIKFYHVIGGGLIVVGLLLNSLRLKT